MAATSNAAPDATSALNFEVIDERAKAIGITSKDGLADLLGVDRTTLWRWRKGLVVPPLDTASDVADRLQLPLDSICAKRAA